MAYPIEKNLLSPYLQAPFLTFLSLMPFLLRRGPKAYKEFQETNLDKTLARGVAFPFVRRFLNIN